VITHILYDYTCCMPDFVPCDYLGQYFVYLNYWFMSNI